MEKWTSEIWRKRRRGCSISAAQWWIDSGLEKPHLAGCFQEKSFTRVQWHYVLQTSSVFLLSKGSTYCMCSQNVYQPKQHSFLVHVRVKHVNGSLVTVWRVSFCNAVRTTFVYEDEHYCFIFVTFSFVYYTRIKCSQDEGERNLVVNTGLVLMRFATATVKFRCYSLVRNIYFRFFLN